jgi:hypothetical protein
MINQFLIILILYLVLNQVIQYYNDTSDTKSDSKSASVAINTSPASESASESESESEVKQKKNKKSDKSLKKKQSVPLDLFGTPRDHKKNEYIVWVFYEPKPWSQIIYLYNQDFPFKFFIKVKIPSLNDYQAWKEVIPNLDFDAKTGELIIPSKDEAGALAIGNLIVSNFGGQLSIETILEKNLIPISINKAQQYEMVRTKLRDQISEALQGKSIKTNSDYEKDLAKQPVSEKQTEPFKNNDPGAYEGGEFSYL